MSINSNGTFKHFDTICVHQNDSHSNGKQSSLQVPIALTSNFYMKGAKKAQAAFLGGSDEFVYTRIGNPTVRELEVKVAKLYGAEDGLAFASGLSAIMGSITTYLSSGDHILLDTVVYGPVSNALKLMKEKYQIDLEFIDMSDLEIVKKSVRFNTKIFYIETPANPNLKITDIEALSLIAREKNKNIKIICDNTFSSPYLQNPLKLGVDIVVESATKYLNGHGDVIAGVCVGSLEDMNLIKKCTLKALTGASLSPLYAFLTLRGIKTLDIRMEKHCNNAEQLARFLESHPAVNNVMYPGLESHANHQVAAKQMKRFGGILSFDLKGKNAKKRSIQFFNHTQIASCAVSLGDAETLILPPGMTTHANYSKEEKKAAGITDSLIRVSVGLENIEDIINDFAQALEKISID